MKAVIYTRVSTEEQAKENRTSLTFQREQSEDYCELMGHEVWEVIVDAGYSGLSLDTPGLRRIQELAQTEAFILVAWSSDRLARDIIRRRLLAETMKDAGGRIEYVTEKYEEGDSGEAIQDILTSMHWLHARKNRENVWRGQYQKAKEGKYIPRYVRLGYDWSELTPEGRKAPGAEFVKNDEEASLVHLIFDLYENMSAKKVAISINEQGYRLPCKSPKWRQKYGNRTERLFRDLDINTITQDELYTGTVTWGRTTKFAGKKPQSFTHHFPDFQIISFEQFNRVQQIVKDRRVTPPKSFSSPYLFSGLLKCPHCGAPTVGRLDPNRSYAVPQRRYDCSNYHRYGKSRCEGWVTYEQTIRKGVTAFLVDLFENRLPIQQYLAEEAIAVSQEQSGDKVAKEREAIEKGKRDLRKIQELALEGVMNPEEAAEFVREAREQIERAEKRIKSLEKQAEVKGQLADALTLLDSDLTGVIERLEDDTLRQLCRQIFKRFTVEKWGNGPNRRCSVSSYEFTPDMQELLADQFTHSPIVTSR